MLMIFSAVCALMTLAARADAACSCLRCAEASRQWEAVCGNRHNQTGAA